MPSQSETSSRICELAQLIYGQAVHLEQLTNETEARYALLPTLPYRSGILTGLPLT